MRRFVVAVSCLALVVTACSKTKNKESAPATKAAQTFNVQVGGSKTDQFNTDVIQFFPTELTVHPGDTLTFTLKYFSGEPHTVTFGTLADAAVAKVQALGPTATFAGQENSAELLKLPDVFPHTFTKVKGFPAPNQASVQPCFVDTGDPPGDQAGTTTPAWLVGATPACTKPATQPEFTGKQSFYNLGMVNEEGANVSMTLSKDIAPGSYNYICLVHRGGMTAKVTVVPAATTVKSDADQTAAGQAQFQDIITKLTPAFDQIKNATPQNGAAGATLQQPIPALIAEFGPKDAKIKVGDTMTWHVIFFHSFSFDAPEDAIGAFVKGADGTWQFNPKAAPPTNGPPPPASTFDFPPPDNGKPVTYDGGTYKGGFEATGIFGSVPPVLVTYKLKFAKAGTFELRCQFHQDMKTKVTVA